MFSCEYCGIPKSTSNIEQLRATTSDFVIGFYPQAVAWRCSVKKMFLTICNIHRKTQVLEFLFNKVAGLQI